MLANEMRAQLATLPMTEDWDNDGGRSEPLKNNVNQRWMCCNQAETQHTGNNIYLLG